MSEKAPPFSGGALSPQRIAILCPLLRASSREVSHMEYAEAEAQGLAAAIGLEVCFTRTVRLDKIRPATYFGEGVLAEVESALKQEDIQLLYIDTSITPIQQRNLEKRLAVKVIDRTGLILEIFGARATTREGALQVELAALSYQKSRLVRSWTHLERQRGGFGFIGGPGESQIELDRRMITQRMTRLKKDLECVKKTRHLHRLSRQKVPYPVVALVGYTNAGKSSLFNRLTGAKAFAQDLLFATLDPMMRAATLPSGVKVILSDTVGFISHLPTHLVAAFRATLEEVLQADLILHVRDITSPLFKEHGQVVCDILENLGVDFTGQVKGAARQGYLEVLNKVDLVPAAVNTSESEFQQSTVYISAATGQGVEALLGAIEKSLSGSKIRFHLKVPAHQGKFLAWLHENTSVFQKEMIENIVDFDISIDEKVFKNASQFIKSCFSEYKQR
jgi:GTP-binding protein HflX